MTLLANQSADAKGAILSHLAPAVAKGSVRHHINACACPRAGTFFRTCTLSARQGTPCRASACIGYLGVQWPCSTFIAGGRM